MADRKVHGASRKALFTRGEPRLHGRAVLPLYVGLAKALTVVGAAAVMVSLAAFFPLAGILPVFFLSTKDILVADKPLRVIVVCRVSTEKQADEQKASLREQEKQQRAWGAELGWRVVHVIHIGHSGADGDAPHLKEVQRWFDEGRADAVSFASVDRFARTALLGLKNLYAWTSQGRRVFIHKQEVDVDDPIQMFAIIIELACSQLRHGHLRKAAMRKLKYVLEGRWYKDTPLGYDLVDVEADHVQELRVNSAAKPVAAFLEALARFGWELASKGAEAAALGVAAGVSGKRLEKLLRKLPLEDAYLGRITYGSASGVAPYQCAIVSEAVLLQARAAVASRKYRRNVGEEALRESCQKVDLFILLSRLLEGRLVLCPTCKGHMFLSGSNTTSHGESPILDCPKGHGKPLLQDVDFARATPFACADCRTRDVRNFDVKGPKGGPYVVTCKRCPGFRMESSAFPFSEHLKPAYNAHKPAMPKEETQQQLTVFVRDEASQAA
jgi:DNA invertase Pin-like site-specific DNA recombinase